MQIKRLTIVYVLLFLINAVLGAAIYFLLNDPQSHHRNDFTLETSKPENEVDETLRLVASGDSLTSFRSENKILSATGNEQLQLLAKFEKQAIESIAQFNSVPYELRLGGCGNVYGAERPWRELLRNGNPETKVVAARILWKKHSRLTAQEVLDFIKTSKDRSPECALLWLSVNQSLEPNQIIQEIEQGDAEWGCWLAALRPDAITTTYLLEKLKTAKDGQDGIIRALGKSGERRCFDPVMKLLNTDDETVRDNAAIALGNLGVPEAEEPLIKLLFEQRTSHHSIPPCIALAELKTKRAMEALKTIAVDGHSKSHWSTHSIAAQAAGIVPMADEAK